jgi:isopenicillin-N epimerase
MNWKKHGKSWGTICIWLLIIWLGNHEPSAYLSVPAAIQFQEEFDWLTIQERCQQTLVDGLKRIEKLTGLESFYSEQATLFVQMAMVRLPKVRKISALQREFLQQYLIEVPGVE